MPSINKVAWDENKRPCKAYCRRLATEKWGRVDKGVALMLPGVTCHDVLLAVKNRAINPKAPLIVVERNKDIASVIRSKLTETGFTDLRFHVGPIETLDLRKKLRRSRLRFAFFDFCGEATPSILAWLGLLDRNLFTKNARLIFTFQFFRKSMFWRQILHNKLEKFKLNKFEYPINFVEERDGRMVHCPAVSVLLSIVKDFELVLKSLEISLSNLNVWGINRLIGYKDYKNWMFYIDVSINGESEKDRYILGDCLERYVRGTVSFSPVVNRFLVERCSDG